MNKEPLFGLDKGGGHKIWLIWTEGDQLYIQHGKVGGKLQTKQETVEPTNIGRANYRDGAAQAEFEAESRYKKQIDKGYRPTIEELKDLPTMPMLALDYKEAGHRIKFPAYGSKKLDGVRCLSIKENGKVVLRSRGGKEYYVKHVVEQLEQVQPDGTKWDGELYIHGEELEDIQSAAKKLNALTSRIKFCIFDVVTDDTYLGRLAVLGSFVRTCVKNTSHLEVVDNEFLATPEDVKHWHDVYVRDGYEGVMVRNFQGLYESGKRSGDLQKYKEFIDEEFEVTGVEEDRNGNAVLVLWDPTANSSFTCGYGDFDERKRQLANPENYIGRWLTVKYFKRFKKTLLPQFPTGVCFREEGEF